ncbi:MAG: hypothetical protein HKO92_05165, partial [Flavobacteriaceae bacterium]|nr:hypothetical protein [Flavobacteriaceae bacterium]
TILVIEPSPLEKDMLWVSTDDGRVHYTLNGGETWSDVTKNIKGLPEGSWIPQIKASNKNKGEALLIANDYRRFNYTPYAYRTNDYGKTWKRIVDEDDVESYTLSIVEDIKEPNLLFLGTDDGLYISIDAGENWTKWTQGFPTVPVKDLVIQEREHDLVIGTFGRAAWVLDDIRPLRTIARNKNVLASKLTFFKPPTAIQAAYQQPTGSRFGADALYNAENRRFGAQLSYYVTIEENKKDSKTKKDKNSKKDSDTDSEIEESKLKWDSLTMQVYDGERLIRTLKQKAPKESGVYKWTWFLREKGVERPSRRINKSKREPSGVTVKPGDYKVVLSFGDQTSEQVITVKSDPRLNVSQKSIDEVYAMSKELETITQTVSDAVKQLNESKAIAEKFTKNLSTLDKTKYKAEIKDSKDLVKSIDDLIGLYLGKVDKRQGITRNPEINISQRIRTASGYVYSRKNGITETEKTLVKHAKDAVKDVLNKTNAFFDDDWKAYQSKMESIKTSPFKDIKSFSLD